MADTEHIDIEYVAQLARINLSDAEREAFGKQIDSIVGYVAKLKELNLDGVEPMTRAAGSDNVFREDVVRPGISHEAFADNAPAVHEGQLSVPRIIE